MMVNSSYHTVSLMELTNSTIKINVSSEPQIAIVTVGDFRRFEVSGDNFYDVLVTLNSINATSLKANVSVISIAEEITEETIAEEEEKEGASAGLYEEESVEEDMQEARGFNMKWWYWIIVGVIVLVIAGLIFLGRKK